MTIEAETSLFDRTISNLRQVWRDVSGRIPGRLGDTIDPDLGPNARESVRALMAECLRARGGEVSARARAAELGKTYLRLSPAGRRVFIGMLARDFDVDRDAVANLTARYEAADPSARRKLETSLRDALYAPRLKLLTQFNALPQGVKFLVDMRADVIGMLDDDPDLSIMDADMLTLLSSWFDVGFLDLKRITWESPAALLEKLIVYEAVHEIKSWDDLRNRLDTDRRCYAFFHPRMPNEPLIFVEVALVSGIAGSVQTLLDERAPQVDSADADTAIFYSITNAQVGLRGIAFGNFLIKKVVDDLKRDFPNIDTFATLSPIPGLMRWLTRLPPEEIERILGAKLSKAANVVAPEGSDFRAILGNPGWHEDAVLAEALRPALLTLTADYLLNAKRGVNPLDPVARFHLGNGAAVERLNWLGDVSAKGMRESAGMMVNYRYRMDDIAHNHEAYATHGTIAAADSVRALATRGRDNGRKFPFLRLSGSA